jgi:putative transposase
MGKGITLLRDMQGLIPWKVLDAAVAAVDGDRWVHKATCRSHFLCLLLGLFLHRSSLRAIEWGLQHRLTYLAQFGLGSVDRSTISHANEHRPCAVIEPLFEALLAAAHQAAPSHGFPFPAPLYTLDATVIWVCEALYPWARHAEGQAAVKLHLTLDHRGLLPCVVDLTKMDQSELCRARQRTYEPGSVLCFDRGYFDSEWFQRLTDQGVFFVTRLPSYARYDVLSERPVEPGGPVEADQIIRFAGCKTRYKCRRWLRLVTVRDPASGKVWRLLTNQMTWSAEIISEIYKARWQIELFFKWLKQHLKVTSFYGRSENAVRWQLLTALCLYLLLALIKFRHGWQGSLYELQQILESHLFDRVTVTTLLFGCYDFRT